MPRRCRSRPALSGRPTLTTCSPAARRLSLHLPLSDSTRGLIGARELGLLPSGAVVVNVSRGGLIDESALADALHSGHVTGAGLDVFAEEPLPSTSPLLSTPNTVLTPHCASVSDRAARRLSHWTIGDVIQYLDKGSVEHGVIVVAAPAGLACQARAKIEGSLLHVEEIFVPAAAGTRRYGRRPDLSLGQV